MKTTQRSLALSAFCALSALVVHSLGYVAGPGLGSIALFPGLALFAAASWFIGRLFRRRWLFAAALLGGILGAAFWFLDWRVLYWVSVQLVRTESETGFFQFSGPFSLFLPVLALLTAITSGVASWKSDKIELSGQASGS